LLESKEQIAKCFQTLKLITIDFLIDSGAKNEILLILHKVRWITVAFWSIYSYIYTEGIMGRQRFYGDCQKSGFFETMHH